MSEERFVVSENLANKILDADIADMKISEEELPNYYAFYCHNYCLGMVEDVCSREECIEQLRESIGKDLTVMIANFVHGVASREERTAVIGTDNNFATEFMHVLDARWTYFDAREHPDLVEELYSNLQKYLQSGNSLGAGSWGYLSEKDKVISVNIPDSAKIE